MASRQQPGDEQETKFPQQVGEGGKMLEHQEAFAEGRSQARMVTGKQQGHETTEANKETGSREGQTNKEQLETEGFQGMSCKGGKGAIDKPAGESAASHEGIDVDEFTEFRGF